MSADPNRRILLIDDTPSIHEDFKKILGRGEEDGAAALSDARSAFFGGEDETTRTGQTFQLDSAFQGQKGMEMVQSSLEERQPYALAFVDVRMPPGWDGVQTIKELWKVDPELQVVICTAYSDYSWDQTIDELGQSDQLLILKKPFDSVEIRQLACAMTKKWNEALRGRELIHDLKVKEAEARAYSSSLETVNQALLASKASAERSAEVKAEFLVHLSTEVASTLSSLLEGFGHSDDAAGLEPLLDSSRDLMGTLDRILDLTQLEGGELVSQPTASPMVEIVREVVAARQADAAKAGLTISFSVPAPVPESFECDGNRIRQVLEQLVDNALRHTPSGEVIVELTQVPTADWSRARLVLTVTDDGPGVPEDVMGRMYEAFVGRPGAGLGLALAHELVKVLGGELTYQRAESGGASFRIEIEVGNLSGVRMVQG